MFRSPIRRILPSGGHRVHIEFSYLNQYVRGRKTA